MGLFMDEEDVKRIREKYHRSTHLPKWVGWVVLFLVIAVIVLLVLIKYLPE